MAIPFLILRRPVIDHERMVAAPLRNEPGAFGKIELDDSPNLQTLHGDRTVSAVARRVPLKLIRQRTVAEGAAGNIPKVCWGLEETGVLRSNYTGAGISVAVLDTGIDEKHTAFAGISKWEKRNFTGVGRPKDVSDKDKDGHGTHCAGTIFGQSVDGLRIGVAPGVTRAIIGKVVGKDGCSSDMMVNAVLWAAEERANIISMSLGFDVPGYLKYLVDVENYPVEVAASVALSDFLATARLMDSLSGLLHAGRAPLVVAAAGNESHRPDYTIATSFPAAADRFVSVAAVGRHDDATLEVADFSNHTPTLAGPGVDIWSAKNGGGLMACSGTSMATPHVVGVAALWWQYLIEEYRDRNGIPATSKAVAERLTTSAVLRPRLTYSDAGAGIVQAP